jgi:TonB-linked SusC/RagA family outer membrane protein
MTTSKWLLILLLLVFTTGGLIAGPRPTGGPRPIKGKIIDATNGQPIAGATIAIKGASSAVTSDANGEFTIQADNRDVLVVSYVGYETTERPAKKATEFFALQPSARNLNEVVVVGYGTQKKTSLTAAVSTINPVVMAEKPVVDLSNGLAGRASGLIVQQPSDEPGFDASSIYIRGIGSTGNTAPLLIVDGVPRDFSRLDPSTIENVTVLKDAAAVAPYGVAGANGVILVTTKKGKTGRPSFSYDGYAAIQNPTRLPKFVNSYQYALLRNEAATNDGTPIPYTAYDLQKFKDHTDPDGHSDGQPLNDIILNNRLLTYHNVSLSGGSEDFKYYAALAYTNHQGMWSTDYIKKYNGILNLTANATRTTTVGFSVNGYIEDQHYPSQQGASSILDIAERQPPTVPTWYSNGLWSAYQGLSLIGTLYHSGYIQHENTSLLTQLSIEQKLPLKGLAAKGVVSYDNGPDPLFGNTTSISRTWELPIPFYNVDTTTHPYTYNPGYQGVGKPEFIQTWTQNKAMTYQGMLTYAASFGNNDISVLAVVEDRTVNYQTFTATRYNYNLNIDELNFGGPLATDETNSGYSTGEKQLGYVYRTSYAYDRKYLFEASGRYDGSYLFAPGHRFGFFPAFSGGWRLSEESFMKKITWIDNLKLRGSWGQSGGYPSANGAIQTYQYLSPYNVVSNSAVLGGNGTQGIQEALQGNPDITWEKSTKTDIGVEAGLWKGLLTIEADYFHEKRSNMLVSIGNALPAEYGISTGLTNGGIMSNHGIDLTLTSAGNITKDLRFDVKGTFTFARNKLLKVYENSATYNNPNRRQTGRPLGTQFGLKATGYYSANDFNPNGTLKPGEPVPSYGPVQPGDLKYADLSGPNGKPDGVIDANDITVVGKPSTPEILFGLEPRLYYKHFDLDVLFQGAANSSLFVNNYFVWPFGSSGSATVLAFNDHWTPTHTNALYPRISGTPPSNNTQESNWWMRNTAYVRVKSFQLGYTLAGRLLHGSLKAMRLYIAGQNLLTWTPKYKETIDPENSGKNENYFQQRVLSFGLSATF